ncbi:MAG: transporter [Myxococcales bacterium]|nr:MAG: transporter [Myxococcales bacterium]
MFHSHDPLGPTESRTVNGRSGRRLAIIPQRHWIGLLSAAIACTAATVVVTPVGAQDLEPRAYANTPVGLNFLLVGYSFSTGSVLTDASLPIVDGKVDAHAAVLAYVRSFGVWGKSAKLQLVLPAATASGSATFDGEPMDRTVTGLADPRLRVSVNLLGAPAQTLEQFRSYRQGTILGTSLQITVPMGQYDRNKLLNLGTNRWSFKPELGLSRAWGPFTLEFAGAAVLYTDNNDFLGGNKREQAPLYSLQVHAIYSLKGGVWLAVDATYYIGGTTTVDGVENDDQQSSTRLGGTLALPLGRYHSLKLYGSSGVFARTGTSFDTIGVVWQYRWGAGL